MQEIERKFLVKGDYKHLILASKNISQGYLSKVPERTVRVRISDKSAFLTIKGIGSESGMSRFEWEKEIPLNEAEDLLKICEKGVINKTRYLIPFGNLVFEIDEFKDENYGLVIAEIELSSEDEYFEKPDWLGEEVTNNNLYYNSSLSEKPYTKWKQK